MIPGPRRNRKIIRSLTLLSGTLVLLMGLCLALLLVPEKMTQAVYHGAGRPGDDAYAKLVDDNRKSLIQILAAIAAFIGFFLTWKGIQLTNRSVQLTQEGQRLNDEANRLNRELSRKGQISDIFTRATEQLGSEKLEVRLGGVYGFGRLVDYASEDIERRSISDILSAFVRGRAALGDACGEGERPAMDVQAALTVLGRLPYKQHADASYLDLSRTDIRNANLRGANLSQSAFVGSNLSFVIFTEARLEEADLRNASLVGADLSGACLSGARVQGSDWSNVTMAEADLRGLDLSSCVTISSDALASAIGDSSTVLPPGYQRPASWLRT
jgi:hypothetical protein